MTNEQVDTDWMEAACPLCSQRLGAHIAGKVPGCPPKERLYVCKGCGHVTGQGLEWCPDCRKDRMAAEPEEVERGLLTMPDGNCFVRVPLPIIREIEELRAFRRAHEPAETITIPSPSELCGLLGCKAREPHDHEVLS